MRVIFVFLISYSECIGNLRNASHEVLISREMSIKEYLLNQDWDKTFAEGHKRTFLNPPKSDKMIFSVENIFGESYKGLVYQEIKMIKQKEIENLDNNFENELMDFERERSLKEINEQKKIFDENVFLVFRHGMRTPLLPKEMSRETYSANPKKPSGTGS